MSDFTYIIGIKNKDQTITEESISNSVRYAKDVEGDYSYEEGIVITPTKLDIEISKSNKDSDEIDTNKRVFKEEYDTLKLTSKFNRIELHIPSSVSSIHIAQQFICKGSWLLIRDRDYCVLFEGLMFKKMVNSIISDSSIIMIGRYATTSLYKMMESGYRLIDKEYHPALECKSSKKDEDNK